MSMRPSTFTTTDPSTHNGKARVFSLTEMLKWPPPEWLVEGLVPKGAMSGLYGQPGTGKSMLALDWALCVSAGLPWHDHPVQQGYALYIAAEGHSGLAKRAQAWLQHHHIEPAQIRSFGLVKDRIAITDNSEDYEALFSRLEEEVERAPTFVIIDTLARAIEGDENDSTAMGMFLNGAERWIEDYGATVLVIHHGNATGNRERGHTSFKGALGALLKLQLVPKHADILCLHTDKQRDAAEAPDLGLKHEEIPGTDSVILVPCDLPAKRGSAADAVASAMRKADMLLVLGAAEQGLTWQEWRLACNVDKHRFNRRLKQLLSDSLVIRDEGRYFPMPANKDLIETEEST